MASRSLMHSGSTNKLERHEHERQEHTYKYEPLNSLRHIRLLQLLPGPPNAPLQCSLIEVDSDAEQPYEAISYAWGDANDREYINCNNWRIAITRNLFDALWHFRLPDRPRSLWADAICIDQQNISERNSQVQLMGNIYSKASKVLLWLGKEDPEIVQAAFEYLDDFKNTHLQEWEWQQDKEEITGSITFFEIVHFLAAKKPQPVFPDERAFKALKRLFSSPVFRRGWYVYSLEFEQRLLHTTNFKNSTDVCPHSRIIQEVALASTVDVCWNHDRVDPIWLYIMIDGCSKWSRLFDSDETGAQYGCFGLVSMLAIRVQCQYGSQKMTFLRLLWATYPFQFGDTRDRVYGLLALYMAKKDCRTLESLVKADYAAGELEAFRQAADRILIQDGAISVLLCIHHKDGLNEDWPSWVPDWKEWDWYRNVRIYMGGNESTQISKRWRQGRYCVSIQGIRVDTVKRMKSAENHWPSDRGLQDLLRSLTESFDLDSVAFVATAGKGDIEPWPWSRYPTNRGPLQLSEVVSQAKSCRAFLDLDLAKHPLPVRPAFTDLDLDLDDEDSTTSHRSAFIFGYFYRLMSKKRRFFETSDGKLGLGPLIAQQGDVVVVLFGLDDRISGCVQIAVILRPVGDLWRLVGPCFLFEVMTGQVYEQWKKSGGLAEDFCIY